MYCVCTLFFFHFFPCVANPCTYIAQNQNVVYTIQSTHTYTFIRHTYCTAYVGILVVQYTPFTLCCDARQTENACACVCCCWCWCCYVPMLRVRMRMKLLSSTTTADSVCVCVKLEDVSETTVYSVCLLRRERVRRANHAYVYGFCTPVAWSYNIIHDQLTCS